MGVAISPFTPEDYPGVAEVLTLTEPDFPETVEKLSHFDRIRDP
ncbi:MAG: hypothetical protein OHK0029_20500 [Armatimonadaceae bacterium]